MVTKKEKAKEPEKVIKGTVEIEVEEVPERTLYMTTHFGDGTLGKTKFDASFTLPAMALIVTIAGKRYKVSSQEILTKIIQLVESK